MLALPPTVHGEETRVMSSPTSPSRFQLGIRQIWRFWLGSTFFYCLAIAAARGAEFQVTPTQVSFSRNFDQVQLLVAAVDPSGAAERSEDLTTRAAYLSSAPDVVEVSPSGKLVPVGNGDAVVTV